MDLEIPLGKRTKFYRFFEMLPAIISYGAIILLIVLSLINPVLAGIYLLSVIVTMLVKAIFIAAHMIKGYNRLSASHKVDWRKRLLDLENPSESYKNIDLSKTEFQYKQHTENLRLMSVAEDGDFLKPSQIINAVIIAAYNESMHVLEPTVKSLINTTYNKNNLLIVLAYEKRGGEGIKKTAKTLKSKYKGSFMDFVTIEHPDNIDNEVVGKGGNITYAGRKLKEYLDTRNIEYRDVIVTTLDSDNRPDKSYFDYVTYEYVSREDRKHLSYQPISLFLNNIWDVPAPMRVIATGNSFWNIISSVRPHTLRNFASHSQPMDALVEMDFWSTRTIVEDGHQYWRSYFHFAGNYSVVPIFSPIYQDAVFSDTYRKTLRAQFTQLRRWAYGASDVPYVANMVFTKNRNVPFLAGLARFIRLLDGHITLACVSLLVAFGGWVPLLINNHAARMDVVVHQLPVVISSMQKVAMIGMFITILISLKMLPKRPERYRKSRNILMVAQWVLMPVTSIVYNSLAAYNSQTRLFLGKYLDKFDVTEKATVHDIDRKKLENKK